MFNLKILTSERLGKLTHEELINYKQDLWEHGQRVEEYVSELQDLWKVIMEELQNRKWDLEYELASLQRDNDDRLYGSGESYPEDSIN